MTTILQQIAGLENGARAHKAVVSNLHTIAERHKQDAADARDSLLDYTSDKIVLDPKLDPDPYGNFGMSLTYRLQCMGWRE